MKKDNIKLADHRDKPARMEDESKWKAKYVFVNYSHCYALRWDGENIEIGYSKNDRDFAVAALRMAFGDEVHKMKFSVKVCKNGRKRWMRLENKLSNYIYRKGIAILNDEYILEKAKSFGRMMR